MQAYKHSTIGELRKSTLCMVPGLPLFGLIGAVYDLPICR